MLQILIFYSVKIIHHRKLWPPETYFSIIFLKLFSDMIEVNKMVSNGKFSGRCFKWQITPEFEALEWMSSSRC